VSVVEGVEGAPWRWGDGGIETGGGKECGGVGGEVSEPPERVCSVSLCLAFFLVGRGVWLPRPPLGLALGGPRAGLEPLDRQEVMGGLVEARRGEVWGQVTLDGCGVVSSGPSNCSVSGSATTVVLAVASPFLRMDFFVGWGVGGITDWIGGGAPLLPEPNFSPNDDNP